MLVRKISLRKDISIFITILVIAFGLRIWTSQGDTFIARFTGNFVFVNLCLSM